MNKLMGVIFACCIATVVFGCNDTQELDVGEIDQELFLDTYNDDVFGYFHVRQDYRKSLLSKTN